MTSECLAGLGGLFVGAEGGSAVPGSRETRH